MADVLSGTGRSSTTAEPGELPVENPATGRVFASVAACSTADLDRVLAAASDAYLPWSGWPWERRRACLLECAEVLSAHSQELAETLTREQGKPLRSALTEARLAADWFRHTAELALPDEKLVDTAERSVTARRVPHGIVAAIAPSNFPLILSVAKIAPALMAGNTVVVKPSEITPLSTVRMVELLSGVLPSGVLQVVVGGARLGAALSGHPATRLVSFTGSVETGRAIAGAAAADFKHLVLELGGNDACIVLPDADLDVVAGQIFQKAMDNSGQFCAAVKRVYVDHARQHELAEAFGALARATRTGDGTDPATDLGPLASRSQRERVHDLVTEARQGGARVVTGGAPLDRPGHFYPPTVVTDLPSGTRLELVEQFGPVLPVLSYREPAEAVLRANSSEFGLGGSVWGDEERARQVAAGLDCGTVWINTHGDLRHDVPFGGFRSSGVGVEYGYWGLLEYTRIKVLHTVTG
ncbi:aldehyde dehydrogenase family protein [Streptomyces sp. NBC_00663]|uniref:aldehyde dehydrogenase family protein n=1 Tax=Streptomyces sp. NBC_00663 TaxID=2975801 RepID=UPI002E30C2B3|nr:aldehyde dehydrogenase family protein [Streptomyces sp. NBC_00663]